MKYELIECDKPGLKQIRALKDIPRFGVKIGDLGGYIEKEENLSQDHSCWVYGNAKISGNARVYGNARVSDNAIVSDHAMVSDNAKISGNALVSGDAWIYSNSLVYGNAQISGDVHISANTEGKISFFKF